MTRGGWARRFRCFLLRTKTDVTCHRTCSKRLRGTLCSFRISVESDDLKLSSPPSSTPSAPSVRFAISTSQPWNCSQALLSLLYLLQSCIRILLTFPAIHQALRIWCCDLLPHSDRGTGFLVQAIPYCHETKSP